ncbi:MAG TPA: BON domain-containing protein [Roseiflexaceae bacterium]
MSNNYRDRMTVTPLNPPDVPIERKLRELAGDRPPEDQAAYIEIGDVDTLAALSPTAIDEGDLPAGDEDEPPDEAARRELLAEIGEGEPPPGDEDVFLAHAERLDLLSELELRAEETADPIEAVEEGFAYVPPIDPPVVPGHSGSFANAEIASGLGISALDEPYDEGHHGSFLPDDDEISARVREALRADSSTSAYAARIRIDTRAGVVTLRGLVDDLIDNDNLLAVAAYVRGVTDVVDQLRVRGLG